ncbi:uncharacterized protein LOC132386387 [Hypanus sabinus]|uniref:uncharacterized protein LOC132386387 n=1 Tax=Hypanus sabinus TaxID=79690 RepID=UPI0028C3AF18|nr:uncharacterized protein LOC132386387 [Hypanus sabinus]
MRPLFALMSGPSKDITWDEESAAAFVQTKEALANAAMLVHPRMDAPTALTVDASNRAVGGVLEQLIAGRWQPLAFFSKHLRPPELKYSAFDRELLALYLAIRHFRYFLEGRPASNATCPTSLNTRRMSGTSRVRTMSWRMLSLALPFMPFPKGSRRNNIRIVGLPELVEGNRPSECFPKLFARLFSDVLETPPGIDRVHRAPVFNSSSQQKPRPVCKEFKGFVDRNIKHNFTLAPLYLSGRQRLSATGP